MFRRSTSLAVRATPVVLGGGGVKRFDPSSQSPNAPHHLATHTDGYKKEGVSIYPQKFFDTNAPLYDDVVSGVPRFRWQDPAKNWHAFNGSEAVFIDEHDKEELNEKPYTGVGHLYSPPRGSKERPHRLEDMASPGTVSAYTCGGNCAAHVPQSDIRRMWKGYNTHECEWCGQYFYVHNRPWLIVHPDWTDEPADDEGPAFTFAEVEAEFDRDFHEFSIFLTME